MTYVESNSSGSSRISEPDDTEGSSLGPDSTSTTSESQHLNRPATAYKARRSRKRRLNERIASEISSVDPSSPAPMSADQVPLERFRFPDEDLVETDDGPVPTMRIWAVDVPEMKNVGALLEHIRKNPDTYESESLKHLKRVRKVPKPDDQNAGSPTMLSVAVCPARSSITPSESFPLFPDPIATYHSEPYIVIVPSTPATTPIQLARKNIIWPVGYYPTLDMTKKEKEWTSEEVDWVRRGLRNAVAEARKAKSELNEVGDVCGWCSQIKADDGLTMPNEKLPIGAHVSPCYEYTQSPPTKQLHSWTDHDSRKSQHHPLRHVCLNVVRKVAAGQSSLLPSPPESPPPTTLTPAYLLTSYVLFITHEPCIMCSMALLHSRVRNVFYIVPMEQTGGCGGLVKQAVPGLPGVNHRYGIWRWTGTLDEIGADPETLSIDSSLDI